MVTLVDEMLLTVIQLKGLQKGYLKLGVSIIAGECILPFFIGAFHKIHPEVRVKLEVGNSEHVLHWVQDGMVDLGVVSTKPAISGLDFTAFMEDELVLILPPGHSLAAHEAVPWEELRHHPMVIREKGSEARAAISQKLRSSGISLNELPIIFEFRSSRGIITAVKAGLGISLISRWAVQEAGMEGRLTIRTILGADLKRTLYLVSPQNIETGPAAKAFSIFLLDWKVQMDITNRFLPKVAWGHFPVLSNPLLPT